MTGKDSYCYFDFTPTTVIFYDDPTHKVELSSIPNETRTPNKLSLRFGSILLIIGSKIGLLGSLQALSKLL
jgi:hypothetical protein